MKRTSSMIYTPSTEARELFCYAINNGDLYRSTITGIINNLKKKIENGIYNKEKAVDAYYMAATRASDLYYKDFGYKFSVTDRFTAATDMEEYYREEIEFDLKEK